MNASAVIATSGLGRRFATRRGHWFSRQTVEILAVHDVDLSIHAGESVGLVGESGCGKTTLSRLLLRLTEPTSGHVSFRGQDLRTLSADAHRAYRASVQPVFQDPFASLDPRMRIEHIVAEPLYATASPSPAERTARVGRVLEQVGLAAADAARYPHEFSGGQRQRIAIARALIVEPDLIVLDEPVSSQDVSIRAQILNLLKDIRDATSVGYLFISHDLSTVRFLCERVYVMYLGSIVERAPTSSLFDAPRHPYTQALLGAWLPPEPENARRPKALAGEIPHAARPPSGCPFHPRCPQVMPQCRSDRPLLRADRDGSGSAVACHLYDHPREP